MLEMLAFTLVAGFGTFYLTKVLLFEEKFSNWGPFPSKTKKIRHIETYEGGYHKYEAPVTVFDKVRRLFGVYNVVEEECECPEDQENCLECLEERKFQVWFTKPERLEVWQCPTCLSFWMAVPFAVAYASIAQSLLFVFVVWFASAGISKFLFSATSYFEDQFLDLIEEPDDTSSSY